MAAYVVGHMTITDKDAYLQYGSEFFPIFERFGGELVAYDDDASVLEGALPTGRTVVLKFPDRDTALGWYHSDDYQRISELRRKGVTQHFAVVLNEQPAEDHYT